MTAPGENISGLFQTDLAAAVVPANVVADVYVNGGATPDPSIVPVISAVQDGIGRFSFQIPSTAQPGFTYDVVIRATDAAFTSRIGTHGGQIVVSNNMLKTGQVLKVASGGECGCQGQGSYLIVQ